MAKAPKGNISVNAKRGRKVKTIADLKMDIQSKCLSIKSILESENLQKLKDLEPLFSKAMADELGINHGRFLEKLRNPIKFSMIEIHRFAYYVNIEPDRLTSRINQDILSNTKLLLELKAFKDIKDLKQYNSKSKPSSKNTSSKKTKGNK